MLMNFFRKYKNHILALGLIAIVIGYITLGRGSMSLAPLLLVLGYCVLVPVALIL